MVTEVWVGGENPSVRFRTLELGQGANTALPIWADFVSVLANSSYGYRNYNSNFPALSSEVQNKLSCISKDPVREEEYYGEPALVGTNLNEVAAVLVEEVTNFIKQKHFRKNKGRGKGKGQE